MTAILELRSSIKRQSRVDHAAGLWIGNSGRSFLYAHESIVKRIVSSITEASKAYVSEIFAYVGCI